ncbi:hypothetical protein F511_08306 [Dorcoceras hygrometricum]|uniref:Uncharacterized protein n=1 Tax=Dorcoceras hygrometricum TaxID=472368 RepID=A0A2Z7BBX0_9LAMI|nr:hypothetical protein F511_08306 [Dorcoceras hygrometricum]
MVKGKGSQVVDIELQETTFGNNHVQAGLDCGIELWMVIHKRPLRFYLLDYGLITRLSCSSTYPAIPEEDRFRRTHFPGISTIALVNLVPGLMNLKERLWLRLTWRK